MPHCGHGVVSERSRAHGLARVPASLRSLLLPSCAVRYTHTSDHISPPTPDHAPELATVLWFVYHHQPFGVAPHRREKPATCSTYQISRTICRTHPIADPVASIITHSHRHTPHLKESI